MESTRIVSYNNHNIATALHDAGNEHIVIFCHGYRSSSIGPSRMFVRVARQLAQLGISSMRFDQFGCGNSEGDFYESSFTDWVVTTTAIVADYLDRGYRVVLFGQSMGGAAAIAVAAEVSELTALVAWVPDPNVEPFHTPDSGIIEEGGQIVKANYWQEAHNAHVADKFPLIKAPTYIVFGTSDQYVDEQNRKSLIERMQPHQKIDVLEGYTHSSWTYEQANIVIEKSVSFIVEKFRKS